MCAGGWRWSKSRSHNSNEHSTNPEKRGGVVECLFGGFVQGSSTVQVRFKYLHPGIAIELLAERGVSAESYFLR